MSMSKKREMIAHADGKVLERAQEAIFEYQLEAPGLMRVTNVGYDDGEEDDHSYLVTIENGLPTACECPDYQWRDRNCKHMLAILIREPVLDAAATRAVADGGEDVETCESGQEGCCGPDGDDLPCPECFGLNVPK